MSLIILFLTQIDAIIIRDFERHIYTQSNFSSILFLQKIISKGTVFWFVFFTVKHRKEISTHGRTEEIRSRVCINEFKVVFFCFSI